MIDEGTFLLSSAVEDIEGMRWCQSLLDDRFDTPAGSRIRTKCRAYPCTPSLIGTPIPLVDEATGGRMQLPLWSDDSAGYDPSRGTLKVGKG